MIGRLRFAVACAAVPLCAWSAPERLGAQAPLIAIAHDLARQWKRHDFEGIVGGGRVEIRSPGVSASGPVPAEQAVVLLRGYVRDDVELDAIVASAMEVSEASGYVQIRRNFRRAGAGDPVQETILIGLERTHAGDGGGGVWRVTVVQVSGGGGR